MNSHQPPPRVAGRVLFKLVLDGQFTSLEIYPTSRLLNLRSLDPSWFVSTSRTKLAPQPGTQVGTTLDYGTRGLNPLAREVHLQASGFGGREFLATSRYGMYPSRDLAISDGLMHREKLSGELGEGRARLARTRSVAP